MIEFSTTSQWLTIAVFAALPSVGLISGPTYAFLVFGFGVTQADWQRCFATITGCLKEQFARHHSLSLQQTLYAMGETALQAVPEVVEVRMAMPNKHHFVVDLSPFEMANANEVFYASDRPYGLIEGTVTRDDAPDPGMAW